jgi:hypothetical protein
MTNGTNGAYHPGAPANELGFWTDPDWRKRGLARRAYHSALMLGMAEWQPDYTFGYVDDTRS